MNVILRITEIADIPELDELVVDVEVVQGRREGIRSTLRSPDAEGSWEVCLVMAEPRSEAGPTNPPLILDGPRTLEVGMTLIDDDPVA
jgi:hypothetical protein